MLSLLDMEWNRAIEAAAICIDHDAYALRVQGDESGATSKIAARFDQAAIRLRMLKRPAIDTTRQPFNK